MRGAVHYDDTVRGVMFHMAKLLINIFKEDRKIIKTSWDHTKQYVS